MLFEVQEPDLSDRLEDRAPDKKQAARGSVSMRDNGDRGGRGGEVREQPWEGLDQDLSAVAHKQKVIGRVVTGQVTKQASRTPELGGFALDRQGHQGGWFGSLGLAAALVNRYAKGKRSHAGGGGRGGRRGLPQ